MSGCKDIRTYFTTGVSKNKNNVKNSLEEDEFKPKVKKKRPVVILSDSEDEAEPTKRQKFSSKPDNQKTIKKNDKPVESKPAKKVNPADIFGTEKVKRVTANSTKLNDKNGEGESKQKKDSPLKKYSGSPLKSTSNKDALKCEEIVPNKSKYFTDGDTKIKIDDNVVLQNSTSPRNNSKMKENLKVFQAGGKPDSASTKKEPDKNNISQKAGTPEKCKNEKRKAADSTPSSAKKHSVQLEKHASEPGKKQNKDASNVSVTKPLTKSKLREDDGLVENSEDAACHGVLDEGVKTSKDSSLISNCVSPSVDKTKQNVYSYQRYLQREGPKHHGSKQLPKGKPDCLAKLVFVVTGTLDSLERDEAVALIKQHGGKVTTNVSRNTSYLVVGEDAGPSKLAKAESCNTPQIDEDGLLDLIREKSGIPKGRSEVPGAGKSGAAEVDSETTGPGVLKSESRVASGLVGSEGAKAGVAEVLEREARGRGTAGPGSSLAGVGGPSASGSLLWVDKYRPLSTKAIIGQQGDRSNVRKLHRWLADWHSNHSGHKKLVRPSPWAKDDNGAFFKAALLSGVPGVGKTTTAHLVCQELGFDVVEFNASDTRSKRLLHEEVHELLRNKSLFGFFKNGERAKPTDRHVLLMDEVDGMAGNEDRGGVQELIQLIKSSKVPIICMCNDRHHPKIRSLVNYCFDLGFSRPRVEQIKGAMMSICFKEGVKITPEALTDIIIASNQDIRQVLHHLSVFSANGKVMSTEQTKQDANNSRKILKLGPWDVVRKVFSAGEHKNMSLTDRMDLFFQDYNIGPLFVQENYLSAVPHAAKGSPVKMLDCVAKAAESLSMGDVVERTIRSSNNWSLLPVQSIFSSVVPGECMEGHLAGQINFPAWLGKNSRTQKFSRLQQELQCHMRLSITGDKHAVGQEYVQFLRQAVVSPLAERGAEGVDEAVEVLRGYSLTREDVDSILELAAWPGQPDPMARVDSKVKAAFTRKYNKEVAMLPYAVDSVKKSAAKAAVLDAEQMDPEVETEESQENDDEDSVAADSMIKAKKRPAGKQNERKNEKGTGPSNAKKARGKGRGR